MPVEIPADFPANMDRSGVPWQGRGDGAPFVRSWSGARTPSPAVLADVAACVRRDPEGIIVCGPQDDRSFPEIVTKLASAVGYPILADPLSQVRYGTDTSCVIASYDTFLRSPQVVDRLRHARCVLRFGAMPTSEHLRNYLKRQASARHIVVDEGETWPDTIHMASDAVHAKPAVFCASLWEELRGYQAGSAWISEWTALADRSIETIRGQMEAIDEIFEPKVFYELGNLLPRDATLFIGNSMPIRDLDGFFFGRHARVLCNRGCAGIDGVISSAVGAAAGLQSRVVLVIGDVSFYHDLTGLLPLKRYPIDVTIILLNNNGCGIFAFQPSASSTEAFEEVEGVPHGLEFQAVGQLYGVPHRKVARWGEFRAAVADSLSSPGSSIIEVSAVDRHRNVVLHQQVWGEIAASLASCFPT
jgi:2-succinyl-5-enolpyruvyl-6-hydroxy-3-cyclohexene-1-carboxylate synthase